MGPMLCMERAFALLAALTLETMSTPSCPLLGNASRWGSPISIRSGTRGIDRKHHRYKDATKDDVP